MTLGRRLAIATEGFRGSGGSTLVEAFSISLDLSTAGGTPGVAKDACLRELKDWCFTRGDNPTIVATLTDTSDSSPIDLTGATTKLTVDANDEPTDASTQIFELTGVIQAPATAGIIHFQPTTSQANQVPDTYFYDIQIVFADGTRRTVATGSWTYDGGDISDPGAS